MVELPDPLDELLSELAGVRSPGLRGRPVPLVAGDQVGRFELVRRIGEGGFGVVFEAKDLSLGRHVALKCLRAVLGAADDREVQFRAEAAACARLQHPNIVTLHDAGVHEGRPFLVLELLRGETVHERLAGGPMPAAEALAIAIGVCRALVHAHGCGIVHRDLKPANVFLPEGGGVKVLDLGIARLLDSELPVLKGGTPGFMAPEQARGSPGGVPADLYAVGLLLSCMLRGDRSPEPEFDHAGRARESLPGPLGQLLGRALHTTPEERPATAAELLAALEVEREARLRGRRLRWLRVLSAPLDALPPASRAGQPADPRGPAADELRDYLAVLARLAGIDGLTSEESEFVSTAALALGLPESLAEEACRAATLAGNTCASLSARLVDRRLRLCLLRDAVRLAAVDGIVSPAEARELEQIEGALGLGQAGVEIRLLAQREAALERDLERLLATAGDPAPPPPPTRPLPP